ncbi:MAG: 4-hydroxy-tetrahydrodipicolinate synthase [Pseudomonadota bacterium]
MIRGSLVALVTPMRPDGALDFDALRGLVDWHVAQGTAAIVSVGTTGESATLDEDEHCDVIRRTVEFAAGRIPVVAGTGANATTEAVRLTRCAAAAGADACLLVTPYYNKPTQQGLFLHHREVAEAVDVPQILYNVPGRTACDMLPETVARLAEVANIIGVKEASGDLQRVSEIRRQCGGGFALYSGDDATTREFMLLGGDGVISVTANVAPAAMQRMCHAALEGDASRARELDEPLTGLHEALFVESNPIPVKWALEQMGRISEGIRLPLTWLTEEARPIVDSAMRRAGLLMP